MKGSAINPSMWAGIHAHITTRMNYMCTLYIYICNDLDRRTYSYVWHGRCFGLFVHFVRGVRSISISPWLLCHAVQDSSWDSWGTRANYLWLLWESPEFLGMLRL